MPIAEAMTNLQHKYIFPSTRSAARVKKRWMKQYEKENKRMPIKLKDATLQCGFDITKHPSQSNQNSHIMCVRA